MAFQRINRLACKQGETPTNSSSYLTPKPFAPIIQHPTPDVHQQSQQTKGLVQRKTNLLEIPGLMASPKKVVQTKLIIGNPGDRYEQEADSTAHQVVQRIHQPQGEKLQRESVVEEDELQMKAQGSIQRESLPDDEELQMKATVQRLSGEGMAASPDLETNIQQARVGGQPLADNIRQPMEQAFGADFSEVKVPPNMDNMSQKSSEFVQRIKARMLERSHGDQLQISPRKTNLLKRLAVDTQPQMMPFEILHRAPETVIQRRKIPFSNKEIKGSERFPFFKFKNYIPPSTQIEEKTAISTEPITTPEVTGTQIEERDYEVEAAAWTADMQIRRGNRRGSIDDTEYNSTAMVMFMIDYLEVIEEELVEKLAQEGLLNQLFGKQIVTIIGNNTYLVAILAELFKAGNCDQFAASTYTYLMKHTNQKAIYLAFITGVHEGKHYAHMFTITSPQLVKEPADLDPETAVVIDGWNNYKVLKLAQFYNGENPYRAKIDASNIVFKKNKLSTGEGLFTNEVIKYIRDAAQEIYTNYKPEYENSLQNLRNGTHKINSDNIFEFDRTDRNVQDMRTQM
ncbi:hypothetical protein [Nostoc sp. NMS4]|uniref:hypothetical protein n=1 Tax=Nostoc sp. NMS4 TaxID=2815390 RepID=UPI0025D4E6EF|nr:hypothetical protein [Nostoc sp. NMS4]MBN3925142.1 hypothetical protein [Nostoc sp. NMS4]